LLNCQPAHLPLRFGGFQCDSVGILENRDLLLDRIAKPGAVDPKLLFLLMSSHSFLALVSAPPFIAASISAFVALCANAVRMNTAVMTARQTACDGIVLVNRRSAISKAYFSRNFSCGLR
jgi:hypothetical protein